MRATDVNRKTNETEINLSLNVDGSGQYSIDTGVGFFNHMLDLFAKHAQFDLNIECKGDIQVDDHHTVEDIGIALGTALKDALGNKEKIKRYSTRFVPMDEALICVSLDISGRPYLAYNVVFESLQTGTFDAQLCEEFFRAFATCAGITLHINLQYGKNTHHIIEGIFKACAMALREAVFIDETITGVMSTKGVL